MNPKPESEGHDLQYTYESISPIFPVVVLACLATCGLAAGGVLVWWLC